MKKEVDREDELHVIHDSDIKKNRQNVEIEQEQICLVVGPTLPQ